MGTADRDRPRGVPVLDDAMALAAATLAVLDGAEGVPALRARLEDGTLRLVDLLTLAVLDRERGARLVGADDEVQTLRAHLRLASELGLLEVEIAEALEEQLSKIGRQLGGWLKRLPG